MDLRETLLRQADEYCERHQLSRRQLGVLVMNDNKFFDRIETGGFTIKTFEKFQAFFAEDRAETAA